MLTNFNVNTCNNNIFYSFYSFYSFISVMLPKVGPSTSLGDRGSPAGRHTCSGECSHSVRGFRGFRGFRVLASAPSFTVNCGCSRFKHAAPCLTTVRHVSPPDQLTCRMCERTPGGGTSRVFLPGL